jgi:protein gp37
MSTNSKIEWTDVTWNPVRGCTKISPGCKHCYAAAFAERFRGVAGHPYEQGFDLRLVPQKLTEPFSWPSSKMVFVNSMSDLFQDEIPDEFILKVCQVMQSANWHIYQILTKRHERMRELLSGKLLFAARSSHIWWGVSVEDKKYGLPRIESLRRTPARVRFLSIEPLLEDLGRFKLKGIDWVIVGGESGRGARSMEASWVESVRSQCGVEGIPFFFKQWGGVNKSKAGRRLNGRTYDAFPSTENHAPVPDRRTRTAMASEITSFKTRLEKITVRRPFGTVALPADTPGS